MKPFIYLDYNASAPVLQCAHDAVIDVMKLTGNAASVHGHGRTLRQRLSSARNTIASILETHPNTIVFTSGGSESNASVINTFKSNNRPILESAIEHASVINAAPGAIQLPVCNSGTIDLDALQRKLESVQGQGALVAVMYANNETGAIQPIKKIAEMVHAAGGYLLCDAVQAVGKLPLSFQDLDIDYLTASGHKFGGMHGCGITIMKPQASYQPLISGGGQEQQRRGGSVNVASAVAFATALTASTDYDWQTVKNLRDYLDTEVKNVASDAEIIACGSERLPNTTAIRMPGVEAQVQLMAMDLAGISVSAGSACSSGTIKASHVLMAMGYTEDAAQEVIRISLGPETTRAEINKFLDVWKDLYNRHNINNQLRA